MNRVPARKWLEIVRFELVYQLRRRSTWVFFGVFLLPLFGQVNGHMLAARSGETLFNTPLSIAENSILMSLVALVVMAAVASDAATRDVQTRLEPLMHAAPVGRAAYLGGRFLGAFLVGALFLTTVPLALLLAPLHPGLEPDLVAPFRPEAYLQAYFLVTLPNAFVATALMFALATSIRHGLGSYLGGALMLAALFVSDFVGGRLGRWELARLLDPTGNTALGLVARMWSPVERNARLVGWDGGLLWNRLLWLAMALAVLGFTCARFRFGADAGAARWWRRGRRRAKAAERVDAAGARSKPVAVPHAPRAFDGVARVRQTLTIARDSLREMVTGWSWLVLPFLAFQVAVNLEELSVRGTPYLPTTGRVLEVLADPLLTVLVFVVLFAGELVWRERDANVQALSDATPVPDWPRFVGKLLGLWLVIVALHGLLMLAGIVTQVLRGWYELDLALYFQVLFGLELVLPLFFALLALSVHVLVNQKHVGHLAMFLLVQAPQTLAPWLGIEHPLLLYGADPGWRYSPISGFEPFVGPFLWFEAYWGAWALLVALVAFLFWERGVERGIRERLRIARRRFTGRTVAVVAAATGLVLLLGAFAFYNTDVLNAYRSSSESAARQAEYERRYGGHRGEPQPELTATELFVEIHPDRRTAEIRGVHVLENRTARPIDTIHVAVSSEVDTGAIELGRPARAELQDDDMGHRIYVLEEPLQPGDSLRMSWEVRHAPRGFSASGISTAVVGNGTFFVMGEWMPLIGYQPGRELADAGSRREHGLPERPTIPSLDDLEARSDPSGHERIDLAVTVGTAADQIAVAPGALRRTWTSEGRRYFEYATSAPVGNEYAIFSAKYAVQEARWGNVAIEVFHHPAHDRNVPRMMRGMEASLAQFTERFGPYPYDVLRMVEYPSEGGSLHAENAIIRYQELFSLLDPENDPRGIDLPFAAVSHEVAHQWWGGQLSYAVVEGAPLLSESLAWYSALGVIEREYGADHLQRFLGFMREAYQDPRARADVPLLRATDWFLAYRKGPFAMHALREYVGQERVDLALRRLLARHASNEPPFPTSLDLYHELQEVTPDSLQVLLGDLFERNTFWELEARRATVVPAPGGEWRVSLDVVARKVTVDTEGVEADVPMDDLIEIGVFAPAEAGEGPGEPLWLEMQRLSTGPQTITVTVPRLPARAGIDPRHLLIDVEPEDNLVDVPDPTPATD